MSHDNSANTPSSDPDHLLKVSTRANESEHEEQQATEILFLSTEINHLAEQLRERKQKLQMIEEAQARRRKLTAIVDTNTSDRFSRAQTTYERRFYRALACLMTLRGEAPAKLLPSPKTSP
jgi:hypothetical protein